MDLWKQHEFVLEDLTRVDVCIRDTLKSGQRVLAEAVDSLLQAGGKRLRPAFVLLAGSFGAYDRERLLPLAAAVEILHMATLVHDDIIDASKVRRGHPTVYSRFGSDVAVFTGDYLFTRALSLLTRKTSFENMHRLAKGIQAICAGEIDQFEFRYQPERSTRRYLKRIARKTALLFALSCQVGALESQARPADVRHLTRFGQEFGMAFQITDDLLDFEGTPEEVGKPLLADFAQGIYTLPVIHTLQDPAYRIQLTDLLGQESLTEADIARISVWVQDSGGLKASKDLAARFVCRARSHLTHLPDCAAKSVLADLLLELIERRR